MSRQLVIIQFLLASILGLAGGFLASSLDRGEKVISPQENLTSNWISQVAQNISPSVVSIEISSVNTLGQETSVGAGTGMIISKDGYILTNNHVLEALTNDLYFFGKTRQITVNTPYDGRNYTEVSAILPKSQLANDIAFLKVDGVTDFKPVILGDSDQVRTGDPVVAIGNALGHFGNTLTTGVISGLSRPLAIPDGSSYSHLYNLLQTDAAINPGNSGGPLINQTGEVIGVNTAAGSGVENIGFAIPISDVSGLIKHLLETGEYKVVYLGVSYQEIDYKLAQANNLPVNHGIIIQANESGTAVVPNSPASRAGLQAGDIITAVDDRLLKDYGGLKSLIGRHIVGEVVELTVYRGGREMKVKVTLQEAPLS